MKKPKVRTYLDTPDTLRTICYFDCFSGISGDMLLGALVDAGIPISRLKNELSRLPVRGYKLNARTVKRAGLAATKVDVLVQSPKPASRQAMSETRNPKKWKDIKKIVKKSSLSKDIKQKGLAIFKSLFEAEAHVHADKLDKVYLHELGAVDCIVDIFGTLICLDILGVQNFCSSPVNLGSGSVKTKHGILPVPAPATVQLLRKKPVYSSGKNFELTTPTGAAIISELAENFGAVPEMRVVKIGMGAGNKNFNNTPNVLRVFIGYPTPYDAGQVADNRITVIETNIDDMNPQIYEYVMEELFGAGAIDVFLKQVIMKKGRPGVELTVLCSDDKKEGLMKILLKETTSIGLRSYRVQRKTLHREVRSVKTQFGKINIKISRLGEDILKATPEYRDCRRAAKKFDIPLIDIYKEVASSSNRFKNLKSKI